MAVLADWRTGRRVAAASAVDGELRVFDDGVERFGEGVVERRGADEGVGARESGRLAVYRALKCRDFVKRLMCIYRINVKISQYKYELNIRLN